MVNVSNMKTMSKEVYERAEKFIPWNIFRQIYNNEAFPYWIGDLDCFWYLKCSRDGNKFIFVDAKQNTVKPAFDHAKLAESLSKVLSKSIEPNELPFRSIEYSNDFKSIKFEAFYTKWICNLDSYECKKQKRGSFISKNAIIAPNKKYVVFKKGHNIFIRSLTDRKKYALTEDGRPYHEYGGSTEWNGSEVSDRIMGINKPPIAIWSPDSKKIVVHKLDQRNVKDFYLFQSTPADGSSRPKLHTYKFPLPGDKHIGTAELVILDVENKKKIIADHEAVSVHLRTPIEENYVWWSEDSKYVYFIDIERGYKKMKLCEVDANTGSTRVILEEENSTFISPVIMLQADRNPNIKILNESNELIWFSERDGWAHLYLYDLTTGNLKNQITSGEWVVQNIKYIDEKKRRIYFTAGGKEVGSDPYLSKLYCINFNGINMKLLTPEDANHFIKFSGTGNYFADIYSKINTTPKMVLRDADGQLISEVDEADIEEVLKMGWILPEPIKTKARDGKTDVYGSIFRPTSFNPSLKYPVINVVYPNPYVIFTSKYLPSHFDPSGMLLYWELQALAEVGFIVITIDGFGTPLRSKRFHDYSYGNLGDCGLEDNIFAIKQLANQYSYIDLDRIGIYGHSGGGYASARAILKYPDFYKVAVSSAGNHDQLSYMADWGEHFQGMLEGDNYKNQANSELAKNLKGKLLLVYGELDDNVHPCMTIQLINALVKANKDYDLVILPNQNHTLVIDPYFIRKRWDYFVQHLLNQVPPTEYEVKGIDPELLTRLMYYTVIK